MPLIDRPAPARKAAAVRGSRSIQKTSPSGCPLTQRLSGEMNSMPQKGLAAIMIRLIKTIRAIFQVEPDILIPPK